MNGKGDKLRKGADLNAFRNNYEDIDWSKKEKPVDHKQDQQVSQDEVNED